MLSTMGYMKAFIKAHTLSDENPSKEIRCFPKSAKNRGKKRLKNGVK